MRRYSDTTPAKLNLMIRLDPIFWTTPASHFLLGIRSGMGGAQPLEVDSFAAAQLVEIARCARPVTARVILLTNHALSA